MTFRRTLLIDSLVLAFLVFLLLKPLFRLKYLDNWSSIESTFIADARMLGDHLPHAGWQPLWYCGTRTDYVYPPALRYGTALISRVGRVLPARAYHLYTAFFYVLGIPAVYWMIRIGSQSRLAGLLTAVATVLLSPSFLLLTSIRNDSAYWIPQRLHVLMSYGEGPHISALCVLPAALAAAFLALREWRPAALVAAGALSALVLANNFYGATALALFYPILVWSVWVGERTWKVCLSAAIIPLIAYGLSAFWLTPSYVSITLTDLKWVSQPGNFWSQLILLVVVALYCFWSFRACGNRRELEWPVFVWGAALIAGLYVLGFYYLGLRITGEPARLIPELDFALILAGAEIVRTLWKRRRLRLAAGFVVLIAFSPAVRYLRHAWSPFPKAPPLETVYQYKIAEWVHGHLPGERVLPAGSVRFWFDAWSDNAQPDGGSQQGMLNQVLPPASWQILHGSRADLALLWLRALGTDAVIVPGKASFEPYHDYEFPEKFRGTAPVLYDDQQGTVIYRVERIYPGIGRIVDRKAINAGGGAGTRMDDATLGKYVSEVENPAHARATLSWTGFDEVAISAKTRPGETVLVQETWDPAWHAYERGVTLPIRKEPLMGFTLIDVAEGDHTIQMRFETPLENRVGQLLFALTLLASVALIARQPKRRH